MYMICTSVYLYEIHTTSENIFVVGHFGIGKTSFGQTVKPLLDSAGFPSKQQNLQMFFPAAGRDFQG